PPLPRLGKTPPDVPTVSSTPEPPEGSQPDRRRAPYDAVMALHGQGVSLTAIAAQVGLSRPTVRASAHPRRFPERPARRTHLSPGTPHGEYARTRWQAGVHDA